MKFDIYNDGLNWLAWFAVLAVCYCAGHYVWMPLAFIAYLYLYPKFVRASPLSICCNWLLSLVGCFVWIAL